MSCSQRGPESVRDKTTLEESEATDDDNFDTDGVRGGRNVVEELAQDNSFIGVVVVALGAGLINGANNLLAAFGVEPPKPRRRKILKSFVGQGRGGPNLPPRRASTSVIRLTDRPAPKFQGTAGTFHPLHIACTRDSDCYILGLEAGLTFACI